MRKNPLSPAVTTRPAARRATLAALLGAGALALSACATQAPAFEDIREEVQQNMNDASSVTLDFEREDKPGQKQRVHLSGAVEDGDRTARVQDETSGGVMEFRVVEGTAYVKVDSAGSDSTLQEMEQALKGRWLADTQGNFPMDEISPKVVFDEFDNGFTSMTDEEARATKAEVVDVDGEEMYRYSDDSDWTVTVDKDKNLRLIEGHGPGEDSGSLHLDDWNSAPQVEKPADSEVVTVAELEREMMAGTNG
ncbi:hypothetical protein [Micrococcus sp.]|uniref:hypothetical protein n=1 Tax=Micrococcus sp. TaxID=1271 RepID=UPI002A91BE71|nr:hypothetical protein [Micrococcus sp.]MDY6055865.1 hypothetical protein [Micrococcus sp.]